MDARVRLAIVAKCRNPAYFDVDAASAAFGAALAALSAHRLESAARAIGEFACHLYRDTARHATVDGRRAVYVFNGATYDPRTLKQLEHSAAMDVHAVAGEVRAPLLGHDRILARAKASVRAMILAQDPDETVMDRGAFIGFDNGVFDIANDRFVPRGRVAPSTMVSLSAGYAYVAPDPSDSEYPTVRAEIAEFYRTIHAADYDDPNDASLAWIRLFVGSLLFRGRKRPCVFLGTARGDNGKTAFSNLIHATLGEYSVSVRLAPDCQTSLVCTCIECPSRFGDYGTLQPVFHAYRAPQCSQCGTKRPEATKCTQCPNVARFGTTFVGGGAEVRDAERRVFPRVYHDRDTLRRWAPVHFGMLVEAARDFRRRRALKREAAVVLYALRAVTLMQARPPAALRDCTSLALGLVRMPHVVLWHMARRAQAQLREARFPDELDFDETEIAYGF